MSRKEAVALAKKKLAREAELEKLLWPNAKADKTKSMDVAVKMLQRALGEKNVVFETDEDMQAKAAEYAGLTAFYKRVKSALDTAVRPKDHHSTVISSADGAKVLKNIEKLANELDISEKSPVKSFLGKLSTTLGLVSNGNKSSYKTFITANGVEVRIRVSDHNAEQKNFDDAGYGNGLSIVISSSKDKGLKSNGNAHVVEFYYNPYKLAKAEGHPLAEIARSLKQALYSGEYKDTTGLAARHEVGDHSDFKVLVDKEGEVYGWTDGKTVHLNKDRMRPDTPIHEYTHLWDDVVRQCNSELWQRGVELLKETSVWKDVVNDKRYADIAGDDDAVASEVHARLTGADGERLLADIERQYGGKGGLYQRVVEWMRDMYAKVAETLGFKDADALKGMTLDDFNRMTLRDFAEGRNPLDGLEKAESQEPRAENGVKEVRLDEVPAPKLVRGRIDVDKAWALYRKAKANSSVQTALDVHAEGIFRLAKQLGIAVSITSGADSYYDSRGKVVLSVEKLRAGGDTASEHLLHEFTHAALSYALDHPERLERGTALWQAASEVSDVFMNLTRNKKNVEQYGEALSSTNEMVAYMSNGEFSEFLKSQGLWQKLINAVKRLFGRNIGGAEQTTAAEALTEAVGKFLEHCSMDLYRQYVDENKAKGAKADRHYLIGDKRRQQMERGLVSKLTTMTADEAKRSVDEIERLGERNRERVKDAGNSRMEAAAYHWTACGNLHLPQDEYKVRDAMSVAEKAKVDPTAYDSPEALLMAHKEFKPSLRKTDPDTIAEFTDRKDLGQGFVSYTVSNDRAGQAAVRRVIDEHWGTDANPWCLAARHEGGLDNAWRLWNHYGAYPKSIVFYKGKLASFCANSDENEMLWWDRMDKPCDGPCTIIQTGVYGQKRTGQLILQPDNSMELGMTWWQSPDGKIKKEWRENGDLDNITEKLENGETLVTVFGWTTDNKTLETWFAKDGTGIEYDRKIIHYNDDGTVSRYEENGPAFSGEYLNREFNKNGQLIREDVSSSDTSNMVHEWYDDGTLKFCKTEDADGVWDEWKYEKDGHLEAHLYGLDKFTIAEVDFSNNRPECVIAHVDGTIFFRMFFDNHGTKTGEDGEIPQELKNEILQRYANLYNKSDELFRRRSNSPWNSQLQWFSGTKRPTLADEAALSSAIMTKANTYYHLVSELADNEKYAYGHIAFGKMHYLWTTENGVDFDIIETLPNDESTEARLETILKSYGIERGKVGVFPRGDKDGYDAGHGGDIDRWNFGEGYGSFDGLDERRETTNRELSTYEANNKRNNPVGAGIPATTGRGTGHILDQDTEGQYQVDGVPTDVRLVKTAVPEMVEGRSYDVDQLYAFYLANCDNAGAPEVDALARKVFTIAKAVGVKISVDDSALGDDLSLWGRNIDETNSVILRSTALGHGRASAHLVLHEMIHTATAYAIKRYHYLPKGPLKDAVREIRQAREAMLAEGYYFSKDEAKRDDPKNLYAMRDYREFAAEAGGRRFRETAKQFGLVRRLVNGVMKLFGLGPGDMADTDVYSTVMDAVVRMVENFDFDLKGKSITDADRRTHYDAIRDQEVLEEGNAYTDAMLRQRIPRSNLITYGPDIEKRLSRKDELELSQQLFYEGNAYHNLVSELKDNKNYALGIKYYKGYYYLWRTEDGISYDLRWIEDAENAEDVKFERIKEKLKEYGIDEGTTGIVRIDGVRSNSASNADVFRIENNADRMQGSNRVDSRNGKDHWQTSRYDGSAKRDDTTEQGIPQRGVAQSWQREPQGQVGIRQVAEDAARSLGVDVTFDDGMAALGSYQRSTGQIRINLDAHATEDGVRVTVMHEAVGHKGLEGLLGDRFNDVAVQACKLIDAGTEAWFKRNYKNWTATTAPGKPPCGASSTSIGARMPIRGAWRRGMREDLTMLGICGTTTTRIQKA